jgi:hypothetical protein
MHPAIHDLLQRPSVCLQRRAYALSGTPLIQQKGCLVIAYATSVLLAAPAVVCCLGHQLRIAAQPDPAAAGGDCPAEQPAVAAPAVALRHTLLRCTLPRLMRLATPLTASTAAAQTPRPALSPDAPTEPCCAAAASSSKPCRDATAAVRLSTARSSAAARSSTSGEPCTRPAVESQHAKVLVLLKLCCEGGCTLFKLRRPINGSWE